MGSSLTIKRMASPITWQTRKKGITFIVKPHPGAHPYRLGVSLIFALRDILGLARTSKEANFIVHNKDVIINGIKRKDGKYLLGFLDVLTLKDLKENYRIMLNKKGVLELIKINADTNKKISKVISKTSVKGKIQLNLSDGCNVLVDKNDYRLGDSVLLSLPDHKIVDHFKLEKGVTVILTDGKHIGTIGQLEDIVGDIILLKVGDVVIRTKKAYAFVLGREVPALKVEQC